jgi:hypothetical protein
MPYDKNETDTVWHRWIGRRLPSGEVREGRTRGAYLNSRTVWVLGVSTIAAIVVLGGLLIFHGHGLS